MDKVFIKDLLIRGVIGISDRERENPQDILVNIQLFGNICAGSSNDNIDATINYRTVAKVVFEHVEKSERYTVEALAEDIAEICLRMDRVERVIVVVEKPGAVRFSRSVGVEIERSRQK